MREDQVYRQREVKRLMVRPGKQDSRELVAQWESKREVAMTDLIYIGEQLPKGYSIESEHITKQRNEARRTLGSKRQVVLVIRQIDTVNTETLTPETWGKELGLLLADFGPADG